MSGDINFTFLWRLASALFSFPVGNQSTTFTYLFDNRYICRSDMIQPDPVIMFQCEVPRLMYHRYKIANLPLNVSPRISEGLHYSLHMAITSSDVIGWDLIDFIYLDAHALI